MKRDYELGELVYLDADIAHPGVGGEDLLVKVVDVYKPFSPLDFNLGNGTYYNLEEYDSDPLAMKTFKMIHENFLKEYIPESKFKVGDEVRIMPGHYKRNLRKTPDLIERYGTIDSIFYNCFDHVSALGPTPVYMNKYRVKMHSDCHMEEMVPECLMIKCNKNPFTIPNVKDGSTVKSTIIDEKIYTYSPSINLTIKHEDLDAINFKAVNESPGIIKFELEKENKMNINVRIPEIDKVIFNDPATIIFWKAYHWEDISDKKDPEIMHHIYVQDKTIVKCSPGEKFNKYHGFCAAVTKYVIGNNSTINRIVKTAVDDSDYANVKTKKPEPAPKNDTKKKGSKKK